MNPKVLILAGMHRSGTSLSANLLERSGLFLGGKMVETRPDNVRGFFEDAEFYSLHVTILGRNKSSHLITHRPLFNIDADIYARAKALVKNRQQLSNWGWKDPRTTLFLNFWHEIIPDAKVLLLYRDFSEVVSSLHRRSSKASLSQPLNSIPGEYCHCIRKAFCRIFSKLERKSIKVSPAVFGFLDSWFGKGLRTLRGGFSNPFLTLRYIRTWNTYNKIALDYYCSHRKSSLLMSLDSFLQHYLVVLKFFNSVWDFNLDQTIKLESIFEKKLLHRARGKRLDRWLTTLCPQVTKTSRALFSAEFDTLTRIRGLDASSQGNHFGDK